VSEKQPIHTYVGIIRFRFEGIISANKRLAPLDNLLKTMQKYKKSVNQKTKTVPIIFSSCGITSQEFCYPAFSDGLYKKKRIPFSGIPLFEKYGQM